MREFGSRDRVMGDINNVKPMEKQQIQKIEDMTDETEDDPANVGSNENLGSSSNPNGPG